VLSICTFCTQKSQFSPLKNRLKSSFLPQNGLRNTDYLLKKSPIKSTFLSKKSMHSSLNIGYLIIKLNIFFVILFYTYLIKWIQDIAKKNEESIKFYKFIHQLLLIFTWKFDYKYDYLFSYWGSLELLNKITKFDH